MRGAVALAAVLLVTAATATASAQEESRIVLLDPQEPVSVSLGKNARAQFELLMANNTASDVAVEPVLEGPANGDDAADPAFTLVSFSPNLLRAATATRVRVAIESSTAAPTQSSDLILLLRVDRSAVLPIRISVDGTEVPSLEDVTVEPGSTSVDVVRAGPSLWVRDCPSQPSKSRVDCHHFAYLGEPPHAVFTLSAVPDGMKFPERVVRLAAGTGGEAKVRLRGITNDDGALVGIEAAVLSSTAAGEYSGEVALDPALEDGPSVELTLQVEDLWVWPLAALLLGVAAAWGLMHYRDRWRPKRILEHHLIKAGEQYFQVRETACATRRDRRRIRDLFRRRADGKVVLEIGGPSRSDEIFTAINQAMTADELEQASRDVEDVRDLVASWRDLCPEASRLNGLIRKHARELPEPAVIAHARELLKPATLTSGAEAGQLVVDVRDQVEAVRLYETAHRLHQDVRAAWDRLRPQDQLRLRRHDPSVIWEWARGRLSTREEWGTSTTVDKFQRSYEAIYSRLRSPEYDQVVVEMADGAQISRLAFMLASTVGLRVVRRAERFRVRWALPEFLTPSERVERRTSGEILKDVRVMDWLDFSVSAAVATGAFFITLYAGQTFGTSWDYLAAFLAGTAGTLIINWALLPWYRKYALGPMAKTPAAE